MRTRSKIASVIIATAALLAIVPIADSADGTRPDPPAVPSLTWWQPGQSIISAYAGLLGVPQPVPAEVVPVNIVPPAGTADGILTDLRETVAEDAGLDAAVQSHGYTPASVVGLGETDGRITVFVSKAA